jgi:hypothetical protein
MSNKKKIAAIQAEIKTKERQLYRANKEMNAWSKGRARSLSSTSKSNLWAETQRKEISKLQAQLLEIQSEI